jgi:hypothetical protein
MMPHDPELQQLRQTVFGTCAALKLIDDKTQRREPEFDADDLSALNLFLHPHTETNAQDNSSDGQQ